MKMINKVDDMFEIIRLSARNYVHYKKLDINFKELSDNLVFITGRNLDTAGSVSNGSGKSVIGDLITDLVFDKTIRRHSTKSFVGSFAKWSYGLIQIENSITKDLYTIKKYRDHPIKKDKIFFVKKDKNGITSNLTKKKKLDTYKVIREEFSINWRTFKNRNYFGQRDFERFLAVTDSKKAEIIIDIMDLNDIQKCKILSRKNALDLVGQEKLVRFKLQGLEQRLEDNKNQKMYLERDIVTHVDDAKKETSRIKQEFKDIKKKLLFAKASSKGAGGMRISLGALKADLENFGPILEKEKSVGEKLFEVRSKIKIEVSEIENLKDKISHEKNNIRDIKNQVITTCPACGANLNVCRIKKSIKKSKVKVKKYEKELTVASKITNSLFKHEERGSGILSELEKEKEKFFPLMKRREVMFKRLRKAEKWEALVISFTKQLVDLKAYHSKLNKGIKNPVWKISLKKLVEKIKQSEKDVNSKKKELEKIIVEREKNEFSEKVYEGTIRSLFNNFISNINVFSNNYLGTLSDNDISVVFSPKTKRESKKVVDKINVIVNVDEKPPRDFRTYSGGEIGKIEMSTLLALFSSADSPFPFLFLDEPFHGVDIEGRDRIVNLLREKADEGNKVIVISHEDVVASYGLNLQVTRENGESKINV